MAEVTDFKCKKCGRIHATTWRNFKNWVYCEKCKIYFCADCSNLSQMEHMQTFFLWNIVSFLIFYFAIAILKEQFDPTIGSQVPVIISTILFTILSMVAFFSYFVLYYFISRKNMKRSDVLATCPSCNKPLKVYEHDFIFQFWFTLMLMFTILSFVFQMFIQLYYSYDRGAPYYLTMSVAVPFFIELPIIMVGSLLLSRFLYGKIFPHHHKKTYRTWLAYLFFLLFAVFLSGLVLSIFKIPGTEFTFDFLYESVSSITWLFPSFLLTGILYIIFRGFLKSDHHYLVKMGVFFVMFNGPFYLWVVLNLVIPYFGFIISSMFSGIVLGFLLLVSIYSIVAFMPKLSIKSFITGKKYLIYVSSIISVLILGFSVAFTPYISIQLSAFIRLLLFASLMIFVFLIIIGELMDEWFQKEGNFHQFLEKKIGREAYTLLIAYFIVSMIENTFFFLQYAGLNPTLTDPNWSLIQINNVLYSILAGLIAAALLIVLVKLDKRPRSSES